MNSEPRLSAFRAAQDAFCADLEVVMQRHGHALGTRGLALVLIDACGSVCRTALDADADAAPVIYEQLMRLGIYLAPTRSTPQ